MFLNIQSLSLVGTLSTAGLIFSVYYAGLVIHRIFFSPLRSFPGYEFYYDVVLGGQYTFHIAELHEKYGSVVRINPHEIHVHDPEFYDKLYAGAGKRRHKWHWATRGFGAEMSTFATELHEVHKARRAALNPFFSMARVRRLESVIKERADAILQRLHEFRENGRVVPFDILFGAYSIEHPNFDNDFHEACVNGGRQLFLTRQFPILLTLIKIIPPKWLLSTYPSIASFFAMHQVKQVKALYDAPKADSDGGDLPTVFHEILYSKLPEHEKAFRRLATDGGALVGAGTVTTAWAATTAVYYLVSNPDCLLQLKSEIADAIQTAADAGQDKECGLPLSVLEKLPYLSAVIQEGLRLSYGVATRLARIAPDEALVVQSSKTSKTSRTGSEEWIIPPGTPVSMTQLLILRDEGIFPSASTFRPERWLEQPHLDRYQVAFCKGSRICLGKNLAMAELYIMLAALFIHYGSKSVRFSNDIGYLELWKTDVDDVECRVDAFVPLPKIGSKGVRFTVHTWQ
ncbi:oxoglutarate/iron-dependent oxygenase [Pochonia chlamydosporia 170]|uniref:Oxoglutarate/iron-dependent oxygenase n=1 Tax=Pochonia chlamydosporia 170 TaxID=1380566 RepID=A0A179EWR6_METCM|nr:oxoglutarate/iron-dependent oxygenase [Pochonia chlamydosporia 170]OAQ57611.1 oxoglutarate/iron-dependent oxygenase [Pochonia chlamydosporia 170]